MFYFSQQPVQELESLPVWWALSLFLAFCF